MVALFALLYALSSRCPYAFLLLATLHVISSQCHCLCTGFVIHISQSPNCEFCLPLHITRSRNLSALNHLYVAGSVYHLSNLPNGRTTLESFSIMASSNYIMQLIAQELACATTMIRFGTGELSTCAFNPILPKNRKPAVLAVAFASTEPAKWRLSRSGFAEFCFA